MKVGPAEELSAEDLRASLEANVVGPALCAREAFKHMVRRPDGAGGPDGAALMGMARPRDDGIASTAWSVRDLSSTQVGTHFFSPANVMKLLENVRGARTGDGAVAAAMALGKRLRKTTVLAGDAFGFIGNRMLEPYGRECLALLRHRDVGVADVDAALRDFGMAMGAFAES